jgi:hypothetical protein
VPAQEAALSLQLPGGEPLLVVPCTFGPGVAGGYTLSVEAPAGASFSFAEAAA